MSTGNLKVCGVVFFRKKKMYKTIKRSIITSGFLSPVHSCTRCAKSLIQLPGATSFSPCGLCSVHCAKLSTASPSAVTNIRSRWRLESSVNKFRDCSSMQMKCKWLSTMSYRTYLLLDAEFSFPSHALLSHDIGQSFSFDLVVSRRTQQPKTKRRRFFSLRKAGSEKQVPCFVEEKTSELACKVKVYKFP